MTGWKGRMQERKWGEVRGREGEGVRNVKARVFYIRVSVEGREGSERVEIVGWSFGTFGSDCEK